jgi:molecular chaperone DnaK (HSP70)
LKVSHIPPLTCGVPQIITFYINANGIVNVSIRNKASMKKHVITIQSPRGMSKVKDKHLEDGEDYKASPHTNLKHIQAIDAGNEINTTFS